MMPPPASFGLQAWIASVSAILIAYQILLIRLLSIQYWSHFAYLIISVAMIGFGASGTFLVFFRRRLSRRTPEFLLASTLLLGPALWLNYLLAHGLAFNPLMILWQGSEILRFGALYLLLSLPFFLGASGIGLCLMTAQPGSIFRLYFANLAGSGLGCLLILPAFYVLGPREILLVLSLASCGAGLFASATGRTRAVSAIALILLYLLYGFWFRTVPPAQSPFKDIAQAQRLAAAQKEAERFGPLGLLTVVGSPAYHYLPDLALNCPFPLPEQKGLFLDGNTVGAIQRFSGELSTVRFLDWRTVSTAYLFTKAPHVLVVGGGAGTEILNALFHGAAGVTVIEMNGRLLRLMRNEYGPYSGGIYDRRQVHAVEREGRSYLETAGPAFDLIQVGLSESPGISSSGVHALGENYLYTKEGLTACLRRLKPGGLLSLSCWVKNPPREELKLMATLIEAFEEWSGSQASSSLIVLRSWQNVTFLVRKGVFSAGDVQSVRAFCAARLFDISYCPGIVPADLNRINRLERESYHEAALALLSGQRKVFYADYPFDIRPATDDRPFFSDTFRISLLKLYTQSRDRMIVVLMDVGYLLVWLAFGILLLMALVLMLLPLPLLRLGTRGLLPVALYFGALGGAYMFLEVSLLQRFIRHLGDPVFSAAVVIGTLLVSSGAGSLAAGRISSVTPAAKSALSTLWILLWTAVLLAADETVAGHFGQWPFAARMSASVLLLAPLGFGLGVPFPTGLEILSARQSSLTPWAWGVNGFCSVLGSTGSVLLASVSGLRTVALLALALYLVAAVVFHRVAGPGRPG
ncbi:MAG TPA: hypothetical protein PLB96_12755 [Syntrophales bacterium]|nr:hypothetical protein [Syntrophales bacterium]